MFNVYFMTDNDTELISKHTDREEAIATASNPGPHYNHKLRDNPDAWIEVSDTDAGETIFETK